MNILKSRKCQHQIHQPTTTATLRQQQQHQDPKTKLTTKTIINSTSSVKAEVWSTLAVVMEVVMLLVIHIKRK